VVVGRKARISLVVENRSNRPLRLEAGALTPPFSFVEAPATELPPMGRQSLLLDFEPTGEGGAQAKLSLRSDGGRLEALLSGRGVAEGRRCDFVLEPPIVYLTDVGMDIPWQAPLTLEVLEGPCTIDELHTTGDLGLEATGVEGLTILQGMKAAVQLTVASPHGGSAGTVTVRAGGVVREARVETRPEPSCVTSPEPPGVLHENFRCPAHGEIAFTSRCPEPVSITSVGIWPQVGTSNFSARAVGTDRVEYTYVALEPVERERAWVVVDFDRGDRLLVPLEGEAKMVEDLFHAPDAPLDLLIVVDPGAGMEAHLPSLEAFSDELAAWLEGTLQDVRIGVTPAAVQGTEACPGQEGALVPLDGSRPRFVDRDTPDLARVLRENLLVDACPEAGRIAALLAAVQGLRDPAPAWLRPGARRGVIVLASQEDEASAAHYGPLMLSLRDEGVELVVAGPEVTCSEQPAPWSALREATWDLHGLYLPICAQEKWKDAIDWLELRGQVDAIFPLSERADGAREADGVTLRAGGRLIPSTGSLLSPAWNVEQRRWLRMLWGLPPGTPLLLRYPAERSACSGE
jgi:hypothetical protein